MSAQLRLQRQALSTTDLFHALDIPVFNIWAVRAWRAYTIVKHMWRHAVQLTLIAILAASIVAIASLLKGPVTITTLPLLIAGGLGMAAMVVFICAIAFTLYENGLPRWQRQPLNPLWIGHDYVRERVITVGRHIPDAKLELLTFYKDPFLVANIGGKDHYIAGWWGTPWDGK